MGFKINKGILFFTGVISWLLLLTIGLWQQLGAAGPMLPAPIFLKGFFINILIVSIYQYAAQTTYENRNLDFYSIVWRVLIVGLGCVALSLFFYGLLALFGNTPLATNSLVKSFVLHVEYLLLLLFLLNAFTRWEMLFLHSKNRMRENLWKVGKGALAASLLLHFFAHKEFDLFYNGLFALPMLALFLLASFSQKWVVNMSYGQKLRGLGAALGILLCILYFVFVGFRYLADEPLIKDLFKSVFILVVLAFITVFSLSFLTMIFFNLPTSSVFEKRLEEMGRFQALSNMIMDGDSEEEVYKTLLDSTQELLKPDAVWVEGTEESLFRCTEGFSKKEAQRIKIAVYKSGFSNDRTQRFSAKQLFPKESKQKYQSVLAVPMLSGDKYQGLMVLLKESAGAFDSNSVNMINTFAVQAGIAVHNFRLMSAAVENERYKEERKIAQRVKKSLLPSEINTDGLLEVHAMSNSGETIGGDYYDYYRPKPGHFSFLVGDVSGSGTSAAFNMAQVRGIFRSFFYFDLSPDQFFEFANSAVYDCFARKNFVTAVCANIDTENKLVYLARAGHCRPLYYSKKTEKIHYIDSAGVGLGMVSPERFKGKTKIERFDYDKGDLLFFFTDGIVEARREDGQEYGYERLEQFLNGNYWNALKAISNNLLTDILAFTEKETIEDDYTVMLIKLN